MAGQGTGEIPAPISPPGIATAVPPPPKATAAAVLPPSSSDEVITQLTEVRQKMQELETYG